MKNNTIIIDIGNNDKEIKNYTINYAGQKGISIIIYNLGIRIIICKNSKTNIDTYLQQQNVHEIIKKAIWLFIFTNKKYRSFNKYSLYYNGDLIQSKDEPLIHSLFES